MPKLELVHGEAVTITFKGTDGKITGGFTNPSGGLVVHTDLADNVVRGKAEEPQRLIEALSKACKHPETVVVLSPANARRIAILLIELERQKLGNIVERLQPAADLVALLIQATV